jgi:hypothetical protein
MVTACDFNPFSLFSLSLSNEREERGKIVYAEKDEKENSF